MSYAQGAGLLGGLGMFLLGMWMITEGLKAAAGKSLRGLLARWTDTRWRGLVVGFTVTAMVQSSSAVTVAVIGFVNAGLLSLTRAVWVLFGSNVGTTMTAWLVALIGFNLKIDALALPLIGIGMLARLGAGSGRRDAIGQAMTGFGLFFLGIELLRDGFSGIADAIDVTAFSDGGILHDAVFVGAGFLLTLVTQSSSASIAVALSAVAGGLLPLEPAAALVIGANLGTTSTGLLAVLNATSNAKRVAVAHLLFNLVTAVVALGILTAIITLIEEVQQITHLPNRPAILLAMFHTTFNLIGVALMWPVTGLMVRWLSRRFTTLEEDLARPRHLDSTLLTVPELAFDGLRLELGRLHDMTVRLIDDALRESGVAASQLDARRAAIARLSEAVSQFIRQFYAGRLPDAMANLLVHPVRAILHYTEIAEDSVRLALPRNLFPSLPEPLRLEAEGYLMKVRDALKRTTPAEGESEIAAADAALADVEAAYEHFKTGLLQAGSRGELAFFDLDEIAAFARQARDIVRRMSRAQRRIGAMRPAAPTPVAAAEETTASAA